MKKLVIILLFLLSSRAYGFAFISPYGSLNLSSTDFNETTSSTTWLDHSTNNIGFEIGARAGLDIKRFKLGGIAAINWTHHDGRRSDKQGFFFFETSGYTLTLRQDFYGGYLAIPINKELSVILEYYNNVTGKVTYSDIDSNNVFRQGDRLYGDGFSIGLDTDSSDKSKSGFTLVYRHITYRKFERGSGKQNLEDFNLEKITEGTALLQYYFNFTL